MRNYPPTINHPAETEFARKVMTEMVGAENVHEFEPTMGAEDFSYFLLEKPGCYFFIGNGDGTHREGGHGLGPCMLHNPSYDFNDELIPLGGTLWVRLAEAWLAPKRSQALDERSARFFSQSYAEARDKFFAATRVRGLGRRDPRPSAAPAATARCWRWTSPATGRATRKSLLVVSSACHGVEGFCGSGVQVALLEDADWHQAATDAGVAVLYVHGLNPWGFSWWRRTTHENVDLNRNFRDFSVELPRNAAYDELASLIVPATWPPDAATVDATARFVAERGAKAWQAAISGGQYHHPRRPLLRRRRADLEPGDAPPGAARPRHALQPAGLDRPAHRPRAERPRRAHLRLPRRRRRVCPRQGLVGRRHLDLRRLVDLGPAHRHDVPRRLRGMRRRPSTPASRSSTAPCRTCR